VFEFLVVLVGRGWLGLRAGRPQAGAACLLWLRPLSFIGTEVYIGFSTVWIVCLPCTVLETGPKQTVWAFCAIACLPAFRERDRRIFWSVRWRPIAM
jgi:hypothetical protein